MNLRDFFSLSKKNLPSEMHLDFENLILEKLNLKKAQLLFDDYNLDPETLAQLEMMKDQLYAGKPLAYLLNSQVFLDLEFYVDDRVLIPRPETEYMVDYCFKNLIKNPPEMIIDAGAGSGCIGISFLKKYQKCHCIFVEKSDLAIQVLKLNLEKNEIAEARFKIVKGFDEISKELSLDVFISNPPYIEEGDLRVGESVRIHEPAMALYAPEAGFKYLKEWSDWAMPFVNKKNAFCIFEFGQNQAVALSEYSRQKGWNSKILKDQYDIDRFWLITKTEDV